MENHAEFMEIQLGHPKSQFWTSVTIVTITRPNTGLPPPNLCVFVRRKQYTISRPSSLRVVVSPRLRLSASSLLLVVSPRRLRHGLTLCHLPDVDSVSILKDDFASSVSLLVIFVSPRRLSSSSSLRVVVRPPVGDEDMLPSLHTRCRLWDCRLGIDEELRLLVIRWILYVSEFLPSPVLDNIPPRSILRHHS